MAKSKELQNALSQLNIGQAFKLKGSSPVLKPPGNISKDIPTSTDALASQDAFLSEGRKETQGKLQSTDISQSMDVKISQGEKASMDSSVTDLEISKDVFESLDTKSSRDFLGSQDDFKTRDQKQSQVTVGTQDSFSPTVEIERSSSPRKATEQDRSVILEREIAPSLKRGFTRIPNEILIRMIGSDLSKGEIKLLLLIARFTISFNREFAPLSKAVIERHTGLLSKSVLEALTSLETRKLIKKRPGNAKTPNMFALVIEDPAWDGKGTKGIKGPPDAKPSGDREQHKVTFTPDNKDNYKNINKYNSSLSQYPESVRIYFSNLKPQKRRDDEENDFKILLKDFPPEEIGICLEFLKKHGCLESKAPCHSPMAYLAKAMPDVLKKAQEEQENLLRRQKAELKHQEKENNRLKEEEEAAKFSDNANAAFAAAFPSEGEQAQQVHEILRNESPYWQSASKNLAKIFAVSRWYEHQLKSQGR